MMRIAMILLLTLPAGFLGAASSQAQKKHSEAISSHSSLSRSSEIQGANYNPLSVVASALNVSVQIAGDARAQNLEEALSWVIMLMAKRCACPVSELMQRRKTMSWGQVAESTGYAWAELLKEALRLSEAAGVEPGQPSTEQIYRSIKNDPGPAEYKGGVKP